MKYRKLFLKLMIIFWVITAVFVFLPKPVPTFDVAWPLIIAGLFTWLYLVEKKELKKKSDKQK